MQPKPNRFDFVQYDGLALEKSIAFKRLFMDVEQFAEANLPEGRNKARFMTHLEDAYTAAGKAIRDEQIARNEATALQEERAAV